MAHLQRTRLGIFLADAEDALVELTELGEIDGDQAMQAIAGLRFAYDLTRVQVIGA